MKKALYFLILLSAFRVQAQQGQSGASSRVSYGVLGTPIPCGGSANMKGVDPSWQPILEKKEAHQVLDAKIQHLIDSIKQEKLQLKLGYLSEHQNTERTTSVSPVMGTNFAGNAYDGATPMDNSIAISNGGYIVAVGNAHLGFYNTGGVTSYYGPFTSFLPYTGIPGVSHPQVVYDAGADRFIMVCQSSPVDTAGKLYVCFSKTNNPGGGWWCYQLSSDPTLTHLGFDNPKIAVNDSELFITGNMYNNPGTSFSSFTQAMIMQFDKNAGYSGTAISYLYFPFIFGAPYSLMPVSMGQPSAYPGEMFMVCSAPAGGNTVSLYKITGNLCCLPSMTMYTINTPTYSVASNAPQQGTSTLLDVGDCSVTSGFMLNGKVHYTFNSDAGSGFCGVNYNRIDTASLHDTSTIAGMSGYDYAYGSVASYATSPTDSSVMIGFCRSGSTIYPELRVINCDGTLGWSGSTLVKAGSSYVNAPGTATIAPWGLYTGTSRKHNSAQPSVWMNGMYGNATHTWNSWIAEIHDSVTTPCGIPDSLRATSVTSTSEKLKWAPLPGAASYNLEYHKIGVATWTTTSSPVDSITITGLSSTSTYEYRVAAVCGGTLSGGFSVADTFATHYVPPSEIVEVANESNGKVYPNPVISTFSVDFTLANDASMDISVTDLSGRTVKQLFIGKGQQGENTFSFNKANLVAGTYFVNIKADAKTIKIEKLIIIN